MWDSCNAGSFQRLVAKACYKGVTRRKQHRPCIAKNDNNDGTNKATNNPTIQQSNSQGTIISYTPSIVYIQFYITPVICHTTHQWAFDKGVSCWRRYGFVRFVLLLAAILCWVNRGSGSLVLLRLLCLLRVTLQQALLLYGHTT